MNNRLPTIYLVRHGETAWTITGQHTGRTDLPLTTRGENEARMLRTRLEGRMFASIFTSPLRRALRTCELAGFEGIANIDPDLLEWDYGAYEGLRRIEIITRQPSWELFRHGCPGGESPADVGARADRVVKRIRSLVGDVLLFSSAHFLRVLATRWIGLEPINGRSFLLNTASLSQLGYEHSLDSAAIKQWNDTCHVVTPNQSDERKRSRLAQTVTKDITKECL